MRYYTIQSDTKTIDHPSANAAFRQSPSNDVAIIGLACRAAGGVNSAEQLWESILAKRDASSEIPAWRWEPYLQRDSRNAEELKRTTSRGYFLDAIEDFDPGFFGISPKEAEQMDPQQRLSLEVAWEALEDAGVDPGSLSGSDTAVYMGVNSDDYGKLVLEDLPNVDAWMGIGTAYCGVPNRISYHLNLMGPSTAVDAACAGSLVAVHHGHQSILLGESKMAIVGGINALTGPGLTRVLDKAGAVSPEGRCLSFDDSAHGYGRGEGAGVVILKKLSDAVRDGDDVKAVLKGSAVAQDGKTNGIMAPNGRAQELVARRALKQAGVEASTVDYVEAHATSTPLGDPTEVGAIAAVYGSGAGAGASGDRGAPVAIGSVKPNIGHLEAGAGVMGLIKAVVAMNKAEFPPQANLAKLNTKIDWAASGTRVVRDPSPWARPARHPRRAAVCSYGYGGTVAHAVVEQHQHQRQPLLPTGPADLEDLLSPNDDSPSSSSKRTGEQQPHPPSPPPTILVLSARQQKRLARQASALSAFLSSPAARSQPLPQIATTLALRRAHHDGYRAAFVISSSPTNNNHAEAADALRAFAEGTQTAAQRQTSSAGGVVLAAGGADHAACGASSSSSRSRGVVWVFSGHGAQWEDMGRELISSSSSSPEFRAAVEPLDAIVRAECGFSAVGALRGEERFVGDSDRVQVLTYVVQVGLAAVVRARGVSPAAVIGHSVGEIAASVAAGCLTPEEGAVVVARRARLYREVKGLGGMFLVQLPFEQVARELEGRGGAVCAAIDSSPSSCVVSGSVGALADYVKELEGRGTKAIKVATDIAFHSHQMLSPLANALKEGLTQAKIQPRQAEVPLYSTSHPDPRYSGPRDADYWVSNMVNPVRLTSTVRAAASDTYRLFLEVSSHPIVAHSVNETLMDCHGVADDEFSVVPTMRRNKSAAVCIQQAVGALYVKGGDIDFGRQLGRRWSKLVPGTQWVHTPIWRKVESGGGVNAEAAAALAAVTHDVKKHTLLGLRSPIGGTNMVLYTTKLDDKCKPFPGSHPLHGTEIVPAAALVNTFHHATRAATLSNMTLRVPVAISAPRDIQVIVADDTVKIMSRLSATAGSDAHEDVSWVTHTTGRWASSSDKQQQSAPQIDIEAAKSRIGDILPNNFSIDYLDRVGVSAMGFPWAITEHYGNLKEMVARVDVHPDLPAGESLPWDSGSWAPILDAATSVGSTIFFDNPKLRMPAQIERVRFYTGYGAAPPKTGYLYVEEASEGPDRPAVHVTVCDDDGKAVAKFESMRFSEIEGTPGVSGSVESLVHQLAWTPAPMAQKAIRWENAVLVSDDEALLGRYRGQLKSKLKIAPENISVFSSAADAVATIGSEISPNTAFIYCPGLLPEADLGQIPLKSESFISELLTLTKHIITTAPSTPNVKAFALTSAVSSATTPTSLAHAPLHGLARIIASEHPDHWGGLIDSDSDPSDPALPSLALKYIPNQDIIRMDDDLPRIARLRPLPRDKIRAHPSSPAANLLPTPSGTYLITGGLGGLGLRVARWLAERGARRLVLLSRRAVPPRREWAGILSLPHQQHQQHPDASTGMAGIIASIRALERAGATVYPVALDIGAEGGPARLRSALDALQVPAVRGVVHAAGVVEDQLVMDTTPEAFARVLAPKIRGALALDEVFPAGKNGEDGGGEEGEGEGLDWMVLFSSCGQLFGFPGQSSYASGNAFLDALAVHRRRRQVSSSSSSSSSANGRRANTTVAIQWTSWRGLGMAVEGTGVIDAELEGRGITDVTAEEAFRAWEFLGRHDVDHGVVLRSRAFEEGEALPSAILENIAVRKISEKGEASGASAEAAAGATGGSDAAKPPPGGPELKAWIDGKVREVIAGVLMLGGADEVDGRAAIADLGVDSVMTVALRRNLQRSLGVKVPPTLTWSHPTANHLVGWFNEKMAAAEVS